MIFREDLKLADHLIATYGGGGMRPTAIVCGTAMLICYAILGVLDQPTWFLVPLVLAGITTLLVGLGDGKAARS